MSAADMPHPDENVVWHRHAIDKEFRAEQKKQRPALLWFTGLSGSGKSTVAGALESACQVLATTLTCSTVTTCAMACAVIWGSQIRIAAKTSAVSVKWQN